MTDVTLSDKAAALALALWQEQITAGIGDDTADPDDLAEWLNNRTYDESDYAILERAAEGDVAAIAEVRREAGLPAFI